MSDTDTPAATITIDGKTYKRDDLSDTVKTQLVKLQFVDAQVQQFNNELAIADTARMAYTSALKRELLKTSTKD